MARPSKQTIDIVNKLEYAFSIGATIEEACFYADISRQSFYNWKLIDPQLFDRFESLKLRPILQARETVAKALKTNPNIAFKFLERKRKEEFGLKDERIANDSQAIVTQLMKNFIEPN